MPTPHILVADDDPVLREAYLRILSRSGYALRTAGNGEEAARMIREEAPALLICDVRMPQREGWWVLEQFPKPARTFPIIMLTNMDDDQTRRRCADLGADGYLVKRDMSLADLRDMVRGLLQEGARSAA